MSFSSLPPELVHQVIESTVPHTFHSTTYEERQQTLCSLSLVSKLFHLITQPLLLGIVVLRDLRVAGKLPTTRASGSALTCGAIRSLIIERDGGNKVASTKEEKDRFVESLRVLRTAGDLTVCNISQRNLDNLLSILTHQLTSLHLSDCHWKEPIRINLRNLRDLTLCSVSSELFNALVDPATVPNLRNFAFVNSGGNYMEDLTRSKLDRLLPQLQTLNFDASLWIDPQATFLHSAASRTLVNFISDDARQLDSSIASPKHARIRNSSLHSPSFSHVDLRVHLDRWCTLVQDNPSLSLQSIYLDSSLQPFKALPIMTQTCLEALGQICQERKIDLIFETLPVVFNLDLYISPEFVRRQKEQRRREAEGGRVLGD
ncbi:hypothetical protein JCM3765_004043 [Sporobolomyces pararoseus]